MSEKFEALHRQILDDSKAGVDRLRREFAGRPAEELSAWLKIALRREALVSDVYGEAQRSYRLPEPRCDAAQVAWEAITEIWQQEAVHTRFIEVRLLDGALALDQGPLATDLLIWLGAFEGKLTDALTRRPGLRSSIARIVTWLGRRFTPNKVPRFALDFSAMELQDLFLLFRTLETTARQSYERMESLAGDLANEIDGGDGRSLQFESLASRLRLIRLDEEFHENAFREMAGWVTGAGVFNDELRADACVREIRRLLPRSARAAGDPDGPEVLTDGGLGRLFAKYGAHVQVVSG